MTWISLACFMVSLAIINGKPFGVAQLKALTGGVGILDMQFGYSPQEAYQLFDALGEAGRAFDLRVIVPQDFLFPALYSLFYVIATTHLFRRTFAENHPMHRLIALTLLGGLADYCENICIVIMLLNYPTQLPTIAAVSNLFTLAKFGGIGISYSLLLIGLIGLFSRSMRKNANGR